MNGKQNNALAQLLQQAFMALRARQFDVAARLASEALKSSRNDRNAAMMLAHALIGLGRTEEAIAPLERVVKRNDDPEAETLLGHVLCGARRTNDGIAQLRRTTARRPPYLPAFQELAGQLDKTGEIGAGIGIIEQALALAPANVDLQLDLGKMHVRNGNRAEARRILAAARTAAPGRPDILTELAGAELLEGAYAEAADTYRHALGLRPDDTLSRANLAICLMEMGQRANGETALRAVLRGRPQMLGRAAFAMATASRGRFFFRPSATAKFLEREPEPAAKT